MFPGIAPGPPSSGGSAAARSENIEYQGWIYKAIIIFTICNDYFFW